MAKARVRLTRRLVEAAVVTTRERFLWDRDVLGFGVRIRASGHRGYVLQYRFEGQTRRFQIGTHDSPWTVEAARTRAKVLLGQIAGGEDPQETKVGSRKALTVAQVCDLYLTEGLATRKATSIASARSDIENHIKPLLGARRAALVTRQDVERLLTDVAAGKTASKSKTGKRRGLSRVKGGRGAANAAVVTLSAAMGFAIGRRIRDDNPAFRVRRFPEKKLERFLSPAELAKLGEALAAAEAIGVEPAPAIAAIRLLILTGCRKNEILTLKRDHVDRHHRCLRLPDSKTGAKIVHIGAAAMKVIDAVPPQPGNPYLLVGAAGQGPLVNLQKPWTRLRAAAGLEDIRIHDLRHAFASLGAANGDSLLVIGALLGHRSAKTTHRYAHLAEHPVKDAAERISREMARLLDGIGPAEDALPSIDHPEPVAETRARTVLGDARRARWLDTLAAAAFLGNTKGTLQTWRWQGVGPTYRKIGRRVVYAEGDLEDWRGRGGEMAVSSPNEAASGLAACTSSKSSAYG